MAGLKFFCFGREIVLEGFRLFRALCIGRGDIARGRFGEVFKLGFGLFCF